MQHRSLPQACTRVVAGMFIGVLMVAASGAFADAFADEVSSFNQNASFATPTSFSGAGSNFLIAFADPEGVVLDTISDQHFADSRGGRCLLWLYKGNTSRGAMAPQQHQAQHRTQGRIDRATTRTAGFARTRARAGTAGTARAARAARA